MIQSCIIPTETVLNFVVMYLQYNIQHTQVRVARGKTGPAGNNRYDGEYKQLG